MSGFDPEAIRDAIAATLASIADAAGVDIYAYVPSSPVLPAIGVFPSSDYISYLPNATFGADSVGDMYFELRTAVAYGAEDSQRLLDRLLATGSGHDLSIADAIRADPTLGGVVQDAAAMSAYTRPLGDENTGMFEAVLRLYVIVKREG